MNESQIQQAIRVALGDEPDLVLWRNTAGVTEEWDPTSGASRTIRYGLTVGAADLIGILRLWCGEHEDCRANPDLAEACAANRGRGAFAPGAFGFGRFFALEVKAERGRIRPEQTTWLALVRRMGGFAAVVRSEDEARAALARARRGESE